MKNKRPLLILIGGPPCSGKTSCAEKVFTSLDNSAWLDGDWVWRVNPFSAYDPRIRTGDKNMSFVLSTYLNADFDYVLFSSILLCTKEITDTILGDIEAGGYDILFFCLLASEDALKKRAFERQGETEPVFQWFLNQAKKREAIRVDTTDKSPANAAGILLDIIQDPKKAGLIARPQGSIRTWEPKKGYSVP